MSGKWSGTRNCCRRSEGATNGDAGQIGDVWVVELIRRYWNSGGRGLGSGTSATFSVAQVVMACTRFGLSACR